jgi:hypothetical protein
LGEKSKGRREARKEESKEIDEKTQTPSQNSLSRAHCSSPHTRKRVKNKSST